MLLLSCRKLRLLEVRFHLLVLCPLLQVQLLQDAPLWRTRELVTLLLRQLRRSRRRRERAMPLVW